MSMACCDGCDNLIDTDYDVECYLVVKDDQDRKQDLCLCPNCRDSGRFEIEGEQS